MDWYLEVLKKYAVFEGRARRKEFWMFGLFNIIIAFLIALIEVFIGDEYFLLYGIYLLAMIIPTTAVYVRRLHDTNRSGWYFLLSFIPLIGSIVLFIFLIQNSQPGENKYGPSPKNECYSTI